MRVEQTNVWGESFIGLMGFATDKYAIVCPGFENTEVLKVPVIKTKLYGTNLVGMFCVGNSNGFLVPHIVSDSEKEKLDCFAKELGIKMGIMRGKYTTLGNMMSANDKAAITSEEISDTELVEDILDVKATSKNIAGRTSVGAYVLTTNNGFIAHPDSEKQIDEISDILGVKGLLGTVNCGIPYVKSGIIANTKGYITGKRTTGIELQRIDDALGF
jgi:translation initiation factor 6